MKSNKSLKAENAPIVRNYAIDALRFFAVCFVIYIHIFEINKGVVYSDSFSWKVVDVLFAASRLAVPIFFAISGWFIFSKVRNEQFIKLRKQIPKLIKLLLLATVGTAFAVFILTKLHLSIPLHSIPVAKDIFEMFTLGKSPGIAPLWFLSSLIIVEVLYLLNSRYVKSDRWLALAALLFFAFVLLFGAYRTIVGLPELSFSIYETWFVGFAWFSLGYFLAKYFKDRPIAKRGLISFTVVAGLLYFYEYILFTSGAPLVLGPYNYIAIYIFTPFVTAGILLLAATSTKQTPAMRYIAYAGKNYALGVFIIHLVVLQPINVMFTHFGILVNEPIVKLICTYSLTVLLSFGITATYYKCKPYVKTKLSLLVLKLSKP